MAVSYQLSALSRTKAVSPAGGLIMEDFLQSARGGQAHAASKGPLKVEAIMEITEIMTL